MTGRFLVQCAAAALSLAACATPPARPQALAPAQAVQPGDERLTCAELAAQGQAMAAIARDAAAAEAGAAASESQLWPGAGFGDDETAMWLQAARFRDAEQVQRARARGAWLGVLAARRGCGAAPE